MISEINTARTARWQLSMRTMFGFVFLAACLLQNAILIQEVRSLRQEFDDFRQSVQQAYGIPYLPAIKKWLWP